MPSKELNLRLYEPNDIPRALDLLCAALPQLPNYAMITPDRDRIEYVLTHNIDNAESFAGWVLCDSHNVVQGFGGAWCVRSLMSLDFVADDIFMYENSFMPTVTGRLRKERSSFELHIVGEASPKVRESTHFTTSC
jgi:hypothetical protein